MNIQYTLLDAQNLSEIDNEKLSEFFKSKNLKQEISTSDGLSDKLRKIRFFGLAKAFPNFESRFEDCPPEMKTLAFAEHEGKIIGLCIFATFYEGDQYDLNFSTHIFVESEFRKQKIGTNLLKLISFNNFAFYEEDRNYNDNSQFNDKFIQYFREKNNSPRMNGNQILQILN